MAKAILDPPKPCEALFFPGTREKDALRWLVEEQASSIGDAACPVGTSRSQKTFASNLASIGIQLPVIERLLNTFGKLLGHRRRLSTLRLLSGDAGCDHTMGAPSQNRTRLRRTLWTPPRPCHCDRPRVRFPRPPLSNHVHCMTGQVFCQRSERREVVRVAWDGYSSPRE